MALYFPSDIADSGGKRPVIVFTCIGRGNTSIGLPIPGSLQFSDGASYNNTELSYKQSLLTKGIQDGVSEGSVMSGLGSIAKNLWKDMTGAGAGGIATGLANTFGGSEIGGAVGIATGTALNKNITSEFTATNTRQFSFQFQLIPQNVSDSNTIKTIVKTFREGLYPESTGFQLKYPPKWKITFLNGEYIPKIGETYLTEVNTSYNNSANIWRTNGAPLETTIQVTFTETKAHTYESITSL